MVEKLHGLLGDYAANDDPQTTWDNGNTVWTDGFVDAVITSNWDDLRVKLIDIMDQKMLGPPMPDQFYHDVLQTVRNMLLLTTPESQSNNRRVRNLFDALDHAILSTEPKD
jgi:hypothetical protein